jgi:hypothetical protein
MKRLYLFLALLVLVVLVIALKPYAWAAISPAVMKFKKSRTIAERLDQFGEAARRRMKPYFQKAGISYPPQRVTLVGLKTEKFLEVYAAEATGPHRFIRSYRIRAASGRVGPKLREGDRQVPEGVYAVESLNPNSRFHVSLRINYPNLFDRAQAERDARTNLGSDIMIHGSAVSVGCLAMGDEAAEDLFVLAADTGPQKVEVILSPVDFRSGKPLPNSTELPDWSESVYAPIKSRLRELPPEKP